MQISAPKFEAVFNNGGTLFRLLQDAFHPASYVDALIAEKYGDNGPITYIIDDALVHYMKPSFKRLRAGRRDKFPNYKIIGLSRSGFTPYAIPVPKVGTVQNFEAMIEHGTVVCGSTQLKRKMVLSTMLDLKRKYCIKEVLFFVGYSDTALASFAADNNLPMPLMAADMVGPMSEYFGSWKDWYYLRCSRQDAACMGMVNSRTCEIHVPSACPAGIGDHSFFKRNNAVEDWIDDHTSLDSHQARNANVPPDFNGDIEVYLGDHWEKDVGGAIDANWGGLGRGRDDSFGNCKSVTDFGPKLVLRVKTAVAGVYFCGIFMFYGRSQNGYYLYTPLPVKNQTTLNSINAANNACHV